MKRTIGAAAAFVAVAAFLALAAGRAGAGAEGEERYRVSQSGAGAFVIVDATDGSWEHVSVRPDAQGKLTVMRGRVGEDRVETVDIHLTR